MNSEMWAGSRPDDDLASESLINLKDNAIIPSIGKALTGDGLLSPPVSKHGRSLSANTLSPFGQGSAMTPVSSLFSDFPTPETSPFRTDQGIKQSFSSMDYQEQLNFDDLLTIPQRPRTIDPNLLLRRKSIHEKAHHSTSQLDQLCASRLPPQGFLHKKSSNEGFLDIVGRLGSSFDSYRHKRHDSNCSSIQSSIITPPLPARDISISSNADFLGLLDNPMPEIGIKQFSRLFYPPAGVKEEDPDEHICLWNECHRIFSEQTELVNHISDDHVGSGLGEYYCGWRNCPRKGLPFAKRHKIHNHIRIHTGERPFVCNFPGCSRKFSRQDGLSTHAKIHSNVKPYICSFPGCKKAYYHSRSLKKHEKSHSTGVSMILVKNESDIDVISHNQWKDKDLGLLPNQLDYFRHNH